MTDILPYRLLDSGDGRKLEQLGPYRVERQAATAFWKPRLKKDEWKRIDALHHRSEKGGGHWEVLNKKMPESWTVLHGGLKLKTKLTAFGHTGYFPEVAIEWDWFRAAMKQLAPATPPKLINLFGYTGGTSLSLGLAGADVTHVDAAKGVVDWGKENAALNNVPDGRVRWIVDDCVAYLQREKRRGKVYDGFIMDPPSYGRGPDGQVFKLEDDVQNLVAAVADVLTPKPLLIHFSSHSQGFSPEVLKNLLADRIDISHMSAEPVEMLVPEEGGRRLPSGVALRLLAK